RTTAMTDPRRSPAEPLFLDNLAVGQRFSSASHTIDEAQIKAFATQFDPQPFHLDGQAAKTTLFGGLAASGWHTAAITMKLLVESGLPLRGGHHRKRRRDQLAAGDAARRQTARIKRNRRGCSVTLAR